jgi:hypothetical protein
MSVLAPLLATFAIASCGQSAKVSPVYVGCVETAGQRFTLSNVPQQHPSHCNLLGAPYSETMLARLTNVQWSNWGASSAVGSGGVLPNHCNPGEDCLNHCTGRCHASPSGPITLSGLQRGCAGREYYTRAQVGRLTLILSGRC